MCSKLSLVFAFVAASVLTLGGVRSAISATIAISGIGGTWSTSAGAQAKVTGLDTNNLSWGTPFQGSTGLKSGYSFVGGQSGLIETGEDFDLGTFTHNNYVINSGTAISGASLRVKFLIGGVTQAVTTVFNFNHLETLNNPRGRLGAAKICADGGAFGVGVNSAGCADQVTLLNNTSSNQTFGVGGLQYILEITGFTVAENVFSEFWTSENKSSSAILRARFKLVGGSGGGNGEPPPSPVPLPAAGWLMLAGLASFGAARARRKS